MDNGRIRVLLVEDDPDDYLLTRELIADIPGNTIVLEWARDFESGLEALARREHDACLLDYRLGKRNGLDLLGEAALRGFDAPVILLTGQGDRELAFRALEAGAADYLVKGELDAVDLERAIRYARQQRLHAAELERKVAERTADLERANASLSVSEEVLRDTDRRKDEFLAMLSHELRNPLAPILNALELLRLQPEAESEVQKQSHAIIGRQLGILKRLVDDLLEVSRISTGKIQLRRERVAVRRIVESAAETVGPAIRRRGHELTVELPPEPIWLDADAARLEQVVANLLGNAAKYTEEGGHICLTVRREGAECVVSVKDTGVGIAPEVLPRVFDLFTQADRSLDRSQGGLGVGLTLAKRLTELHGGRVEARSTLGEGSEFVVRLPVASAAVAPESPRPREPKRIERALRVLVVDDSLDTALTFAMLLKDSGHDVRTAHDGPTAVQAALDYRPDVVLLDIGLPGLNGYDVAKRIRLQPALSRVALVALTGYGQETDRQASREAGFDYHLVKPTGYHDVHEILATIAERPE